MIKKLPYCDGCDGVGAPHCRKALSPIINVTLTINLVVSITPILRGENRDFKE